MSRPIIRIHNLETDEIIDREMNDEEFADYQQDMAETAAKEAEVAAKKQARQAILDRLGLSEEEARLLLG